MPTIRIDSVLGGHSPSTHYASSGQYRASLGIDPAQPMDDADSIYSTMASGLIRPAASEKYSSTTLTTTPLFMKTNPKDALIYVYGANSSIYTVDAGLTTVTALNDRGWLDGSKGNGCAYYDNYMYFATNDDILRYGPLNGAPGFSLDANMSYWQTTLGLTALADTAYPKTFKNNLQIPNHPMCRHSDGRLYIGDVVGNTGSISFIQTTTTAVEGDTDDGSTYDHINVGYGLWPTAIESYGADLAIAFYEGSDGALRQPRAKIAFWDTTSTNVNKITWKEFPDTLITAMKNVNGVLYVVSGNVDNQGFRVSQFVGGYTFQEVFYSETGEPCLPGAIDGVLNRVMVGNYTTVPESDGCVYSVGLQKERLGAGVFNVMRATGGDSSTCVTSVLVADNVAFGYYAPTIGWSQAGDGSTGVSYGLDKQGVAYNNAPSNWWSQLYRVGEHFKITQIRIPFAQAVAANMTLTPKIYTDNGAGITYTLKEVNNTDYSGKRYVVYRSDSTSNELTGRNNFWLELKWTGSALLTVELPIIITFETVRD
jgi:hypothetical protein